MLNAICAVARAVCIFNLQLSLYLAELYSRNCSIEKNVINHSLQGLIGLECLTTRVSSPTELYFRQVVNSWI